MIINKITMSNSKQTTSNKRPLYAQIDAYNCNSEKITMALTKGHSCIFTGNDELAQLMQNNIIEAYHKIGIGDRVEVISPVKFMAKALLSEPDVNKIYLIKANLNNTVLPIIQQLMHICHNRFFCSGIGDIMPWAPSISLSLDIREIATNQHNIQNTISVLGAKLGWEGISEAVLSLENGEFLFLTSSILQKFFLLPTKQPEQNYEFA